MQVIPTDKCHTGRFTLFGDSIRMLAIVIQSPLTKKTPIKGCLLVFTLFIYGLSPLRSRLFFRPSGHN